MIDFLLESLFWQSLSGLMLSAVLAAPFGCFLLWRRIVFFGDTLAHSGFLGVAIGLLAGIATELGVFLTVAILALLIVRLQRNSIWSSDTVLGLVSHATLATGLVMLSFRATSDIRLVEILAGDVLSLRLSEIGVFAALAVGALAILWIQRRILLVCAIDPDLARLGGQNANRTESLFFVLLALAIMLLVRMVGVLPAMGMMIIPPATARMVSRSPEQMMAISVLVAIKSCVVGTIFSFLVNTPPGPAVVLAASVIFLIVLFWRALRQQRLKSRYDL